MLKVLRLVPAVGVPQAAEGRGAARRLLRAALLRAAGQAVRLAERLEAAEAAARERAVCVAPARPQLPAAVGGVRRVEAVVLLAVAAYFVAGLVAALVA